MRPGGEPRRIGPPHGRDVLVFGSDGGGTLYPVPAAQPPASGRVLVMAGPHLDPLLIRQLASGRTDLGELAEVFLAGRTGREQDEHPGGHAALVGEGVDPALRT